MIYRGDLEKVYALIEREENWCQTHLSVDIDGVAVPPSSSKVAKRCLIGAIDAALPESWSGCCGAETQIVIENLLGVTSIPAFNDTHTHAEVLALLKRAIERAPVRP